MVPVMSAEDIHDATETFERYGVPADRIFNEVMRARYLDYVLFLKPENVQYGISIEDLYENMKKTSDRLGLYEGDEDLYVKAYTFALRVDPMVFAPGVGERNRQLQLLLAEVVEKAKKAKSKVLFSGVESYMIYLAHIADQLPDKRLAFAVKDEIWKKRLQLVFPRCRLMTTAEIEKDTETYDYIFNEETENVGNTAALLKRLSGEGAMDTLISVEAMMDESNESGSARQEMAGSGKLSAFYDAAVAGREYDFLRFVPSSDTISFGETDFSGESLKLDEKLSLPLETFREAGEWNYDIYAFNGSPAIQAILSANVLQMEHTVGSEYELVKPDPLPKGTYAQLQAENIEDYGLDLSDAAEGTFDEGNEEILLKGGDLAFTLYRGRFTMAVIPEGLEFLAGHGVYGFRSRKAYTAPFLKLYLDGPVGHLFLENMKAGNGYNLAASRVLRTPLPSADEETISQADRLCRNAVSQLAAAEKKWKDAKRLSVGLMMGH